MSSVSLPYTTLDGRIETLEPVPWYWRLFSHLSTWLILGGYLAFPYLTTTAVVNADGSTTAPPIVSTTALIIVVTSFITAGNALTPLLIFATPHNRDFHLHSVFLPAFSATLLGTLSHVLVASLTPYHSISLLAGVVGTCLGVISSTLYCAFALYASGIVHSRVGRPDPYGRRVLPRNSFARNSITKTKGASTDRNASYSSSTVLLAPYASQGQGLRHQSSSASGGSSNSRAHANQQTHYVNPSQSNNISHFPPAPFIHPLQNFNWQQQQQQQQSVNQRHGRRGSGMSSHQTPPASQSPFAQAPVSIVPRPREVGTAMVDIEDDEMTRQQMAALLSQGRRENNVSQGATYRIDFPGGPKGDGYQSSADNTPLDSCVTTPAAHYGLGPIPWNRGMRTLAESPIEGDEGMDQVYEVEGAGPTSLLAHNLASSGAGDDTGSSGEKTGLHESAIVHAPRVSSPTPPPAVAIPLPPTRGRRLNAMNALGAAVLGESNSNERQRQMSESEADRAAREKRERREARQHLEEEQRDRDREQRREEAERKRRKMQEQEREDAMLERRQEGEELRRQRELLKQGRKPTFQDFSPVRLARQKSAHSVRSRSQGSGRDQER